MEYFVARAMDVARLSAKQIEVLHRVERSDVGRPPRCFMPSESSRAFRLGTVKDHWGIPDAFTVAGEAAQAAHRERIEAMLKGRPWFNADYAKLGSSQVGLVHAFDEAVRADSSLNFMCVAARKPGRRLSDQMDQPTDSP